MIQTPIVRGVTSVEPSARSVKLRINNYSRTAQPARPLVPALLTFVVIAVAAALHAQAGTTTTLTASTTMPGYGSSVTFTVTVNGSSPTGTVILVGNTYNTLATCILSGGSCSFSITNLIPGRQSLVAKYGGDGANLSSNSSPLTITVGARTLTSTRTTLNASPKSGSYGTNVTLTASVVPPAATGSITFRQGSNVLGTARLIPVAGDGIASSLFGLTVNSSFLSPAVNYETNRGWNSQQDISWSSNNPSRGVYNWANMDAWVAANTGKDMIYNLARTPQWASLYPNNRGGYGPGQCAPPSNMTYWDDYLTAVATRYPQIRYWEIWNEPQDVHSYCGATVGSAGSISTMALMSQHANHIIKGINADAMILSPATTSWYPNGYGAAWMSAFLKEGGTFDIFAFHGYIKNPGMAEDEAGIVASVQATMAAAGISKPMWDTEAGWYTGAQPVLAAARQPGFIVKMFIIQQSLGVARFLWYQYTDAPQWGQMYNTSTGENTNVAAYNTAYSWLVGATLSSACYVGEKVETCAYTRPGGYVAQVVWETNSNGSTYSYAYPSGMTQYVDVTGTLHPISGGTVMIGDTPILLENRNIPAYRATLTTTSLPAGTQSLTAIYPGDTNYATSTSPPTTVAISTVRPSKE